MLYAGCDLHKQTITICVVNQMRIVILRKTRVAQPLVGLGAECTGRCIVRFYVMTSVPNGIAAT